MWNTNLYSLFPASWNENYQCVHNKATYFAKCRQNYDLQSYLLQSQELSLVFIREFARKYLPLFMKVSANVRIFITDSVYRFTVQEF